MATTLGSLRTLAQQRSDMVNGGFVTNAEWNQYINDALAEVYGLIVQRYGDDYLVKATPYAFSTDGTNTLFALPTDFFKLVGLEIQYGGAPNTWISVPQFMFSERNGMSPIVYGVYAVLALRYRLLGTNVMLVTPAGQIPPPAGYNLRMWYVPACPALAADGDAVPAAIDGFGWLTDYVSLCAAIKALLKEESDIAGHLLLKKELVARIESEAANRNAAAPQRVPNVGGSGATWWGNEDWW